MCSRRRYDKTTQPPSETFEIPRPFLSRSFWILAEAELFVINTVNMPTTLGIFQGLLGLLHFDKNAYAEWEHGWDRPLPYRERNAFFKVFTGLDHEGLHHAGGELPDARGKQVLGTIFVPLPRSTVNPSCYKSESLVNVLNLSEAGCFLTFLCIMMTNSERHSVRLSREVHWNGCRSRGVSFR